MEHKSKVCKYCEHAYLRPCNTPAKAEACPNIKTAARKLAKSLYPDEKRKRAKKGK